MLGRTRAGTPEGATVAGVRVAGLMPRAPRCTEQRCCLAEAEGKDPPLERSIRCEIHCHTPEILPLIPGPTALCGLIAK